MMKKFAGFVALLLILTLLPAAFGSTPAVALNDGQMATIHGSGYGCDLTGGISAGLVIGAVACPACGVAGAILAAGYFIWC